MKVTLANMRSLACRNLIINCSNTPRCWHSVTINADRWGDDVSLSQIEAKFVCTRCGAIGGEARPDYSMHTSQPAGGNIAR